MAVDPVRPVRFEGDALHALDQTRLPGEEVWLALRTPEQVIEAIAGEVAGVKPGRVARDVLRARRGPP